MRVSKSVSIIEANKDQGINREPTPMMPQKMYYLEKGTGIPSAAGAIPSNASRAHRGAGSGSERAGTHHREAKTGSARARARPHQVCFGVIRLPIRRGKKVISQASSPAYTNSAADARDWLLDSLVAAHRISMARLVGI